MAELNDQADALNQFIGSYLADHVNTALECVVVAYKEGKVDVKPIGNKNFTDGDSNAFPTLFSLPLHWPQGDGGQAGFKVPVKVGDKCLAIIAQQPQDDGDTEDVRRFSLADAYVIPGVSYTDARPANNSLMMYYGEAFIEITADGKINFNAPGGETHTTPLATFSKAATVNGLFTFNGGATGVGDNGTGNVVTFKGRVVADKATIDGRDFTGHSHKGVQTGSGSTGAIN